MSNFKILIVDDEESFLELITARVEGWGYDVVKAVNGKDAIAAVKDNRPDIVILDYRLPDMDGVAVLKEIRKTDKDIPVIMFTAYPDTAVMKDSEKLGISAFIPKLSAYTEAIPSLRSAINMVEKLLP